MSQHLVWVSGASLHVSLTLFTAPQAHAFCTKIMSTDALKQQILEALASGKIQATTINIGDHVEHQHNIGKVEAGGIGFQIVESTKQAIARPKENDYNAVREYIEARKEQDSVFKTFCKSHTRKQVCDFLSLEFGWQVQSHQLGVNVNRNQ